YQSDQPSTHAAPAAVHLCLAEPRTTTTISFDLTTLLTGRSISVVRSSMPRADAKALARAQYTHVAIGCSITERPSKECNLGDGSHAHHLANRGKALHDLQRAREPDAILGAIDE